MAKKAIVASAVVLSGLFLASCGTTPATNGNENVNAMNAAIENMNENIQLDSLDLEYSMNSNMNSSVLMMNMNANAAADATDMGLSMNGSAANMANINVNADTTTGAESLFNNTNGATSSMN